MCFESFFCWHSLIASAFGSVFFFMVCLWRWVCVGDSDERCALKDSGCAVLFCEKLESAKYPFCFVLFAVYAINRKFYIMIRVWRLFGLFFGFYFEQRFSVFFGEYVYLKCILSKPGTGFLIFCSLCQL